MKRSLLVLAAVLFVTLVPNSPVPPSGCFCFDPSAAAPYFKPCACWVEIWRLPNWGGTPAHAGALDERAPVTVQASPRELFALRLALTMPGMTFKGEDQDAEARVSEALGFAAIDARVKAIGREKASTPECRAARGNGSACEANGEDFSDKHVSKTLPKDDAGRVVDWLRAASLPGAFNEILAPLVRELKRASGK